MFAIEVWNCFIHQFIHPVIIFFLGGGGVGIQDSHWKIQTHKIYIQFPKIGLGNHQPSAPFANKFIPRTTFRIRARSLYPIFTTISVWSRDRTRLVRLHLTRLPPMLKLIVIKYGAVKVVTTR